MSTTTPASPPVEFPAITEELRQRCLEHAKAEADLRTALEEHFRGKDVIYRDPESTHHGIYKVSNTGWNGSVGFNFRIYMPDANFRSSRVRRAQLDDLGVESIPA